MVRYSLKLREGITLARQCVTKAPYRVEEARSTSLDRLDEYFLNCFAYSHFFRFEDLTLIFSRQNRDFLIIDILSNSDVHQKALHDSQKLL